MDKSMTGDGAVVHYGCAHEYAKTHANPFLIRNEDGSLNQPVNLARAYLAQAAEIERLTRSGVGLTVALDNAIRERFASEARNADLLKALEDIARRTESERDHAKTRAPDEDDWRRVLDDEPEAYELGIYHAYQAVASGVRRLVAAAKGETPDLSTMEIDS